MALAYYEARSYNYQRLRVYILNAADMIAIWKHKPKKAIIIG